MRGAFLLVGLLSLLSSALSVGETSVQPGGLSQQKPFSPYNADPNQRKALQALYLAEVSGQLGDLGLHYLYPISYAVQVVTGIKYYIVVEDEVGDFFTIVLWVRPSTVIPVVISVL